MILSAEFLKAVEKTLFHFYFSLGFFVGGKKK